MVHSCDNPSNIFTNFAGRTVVSLKKRLFNLSARNLRTQWCFDFDAL